MHFIAEVLGWEADTDTGNRSAIMREEACVTVCFLGRSVEPDPGVALLTTSLLRAPLAAMCPSDVAAPRQ